MVDLTEEEPVTPVKREGRVGAGGVPPPAPVKVKAPRVPSVKPEVKAGYPAGYEELLPGVFAWVDAESRGVLLGESLLSASGVLGVLRFSRQPLLVAGQLRHSVWRSSRPLQLEEWQFVMDTVRNLRPLLTGVGLPTDDRMLQPLPLPGVTIMPWRSMGMGVCTHFSN